MKRKESRREFGKENSSGKCLRKVSRMWPLFSSPSLHAAVVIQKFPSTIILMLILLQYTDTYLITNKQQNTGRLHHFDLT